MGSTTQSTTTMDASQTSSTSQSSPIFDLVCIGFGPAQLATAIANHETRQPHNVLYLEQKSSFSWSSTPQLSRTRMEAPFIYDLATLRNPRSAFSYANYLLNRSRLIEFANSDRLNPLREEFDDYLRWCAGQFEGQVRYGSKVVNVLPDTEAGLVKSWKVTVKDARGDTYVVRTRSVVAPSPSKDAASTVPQLTKVDFLSGQRIISAQDYVSRRDELRGAHEPRLNVSVVGSGHQMSEILDDLLSCSRLGNITIVTEDDSLAPLKVLDQQQPPQPQLCSIWTKPQTSSSTAVTDASELVQTIYMRAYEKQVQSKGEYRLRVVVGGDAAEACAGSDFIIRDTTTSAMPSTQLLQSLDSLALGCRQRGESLDEVHFKRNAVADGCRLWLLSNAGSKRALAKDLSLMAGEIVKNVSSAATSGRDVQIQARI